MNEAKSLVQKNYLDKKIIHMIVKKFIFDDEEFLKFLIKKLITIQLIIELKFICFQIKFGKIYKIVLIKII